MGYFSVLGADDESDDHASLGEPLFDSDAEFSDGENVEGALKEALEDDKGQEAKEDHGMEEHARKPMAKAIARPVSPTKVQLEKHDLEGHANYLAGCEYCVRCRGRADKHFKSGKDCKEFLDGEDTVPMVSMDFCFLAQEEQEKSTPALVIKEHRTKYMGARACPGKSTVQEEYSNKIVEWTAEFLDFLGYPRVALKSDGENSMKALQRRVQQARSMKGRQEAWRRKYGSCEFQEG